MDFSFSEKIEREVRCESNVLSITRDEKMTQTTQNGLSVKQPYVSKDFDVFGGRGMRFQNFANGIELFWHFSV